MKAGRIAGIVVVAGVIAGVAYWQLGPPPGAGVRDVEPTFVTPERRTIASTVLATGVIRLRSGAEVRVGSQLSGIVVLYISQGSITNKSAFVREAGSKVAFSDRNLEV